MKTTDQRDVVYSLSIDQLFLWLEIEPGLYAQIPLPMGEPWWTR